MQLPELSSIDHCLVLSLKKKKRKSFTFHGRHGSDVLLLASQIRSNKLIYQGKPRLKTALELLRTSISLELRLGEVRPLATTLLSPSSIFPWRFN